MKSTKSYIPFLKSVAMELTARYGNTLHLFTLMLPHKRGVTFMRRYLEEELSARLLRNPRHNELPDIITISELTNRASGLRPGTRLELLFTLYNAYRELFVPTDVPPTAAEFEEFRSWGETVVSDFNDVDMYCVQADDLFRNLSDFNDIRTDFLTDEQKLIIEQYFGVTDPGSHITGFWRHCHRSSDTQKRFLSLWERLAPLYHRYRIRLAESGLSYPGMAYGRAREAIESGSFTFKGPVAFIGFNALSTAERKLFTAVKKLRDDKGQPLAGFFWDAPGPALRPDAPVDAARILLKNAKEFPCSITGMANYTDAYTFSEVIHEVACPGNTAQAKVAGQLLRGILKDKDSNYIDRARVAVVLPDEGLLFPMFHSVPSDIVHSVNLTMGYPLRLSAVAAFVNELRQLHSHSRRSIDGYRLFSKDVGTLLGHPLTRIMLGQETSNILRGLIVESHQYFITLPEMLQALEKKQETVSEHERETLSGLFSPLPDSDEPARVCGALCDVLRMAKEALDKDKPKTEGDVRAGTLETVHLERYLEAFSEFSDLCTRFGMRMDPSSTLNMAYRLLSTETVPMQGEPLSGLQIMGMLETRALDFDYLIIPSMNERIFPRKLRRHTFIPDALRMGFGIATTRFQEEIFAYHFYRLIARAREVYLLYDASQGGLRSGDPSRYLLQLEHLFGEERKPVKHTARFRLQSPAPARSISIAKQGRVLDNLKRYTTAGSGKNLSPSNLKTYLNCPVQFCLSYILDKKVDDAPTDFMGAALIGNVLHETMQELYDSLRPSPEKPATVTPELIDGWLNGTVSIGNFPDIRAIAESKIRKEYMKGAAPDVPLSGDALITLDLIVQQVRWCLQADRRLGEFQYLASEKKLEMPYTMENGTVVNMKLVIDRLDRIKLPDGSWQLRIVDYKTGGDNTSFNKLDELFRQGGEHQAIFQLLAYALLYDMAAPEITQRKPIAIAIYKTLRLSDESAGTTVEMNGEPLYSFQPLMKDFRERLDNMLEELFNPSQPIVPPEGMPTDNDQAKTPCRFCVFKSLCLS